MLREYFFTIKDEAEWHKYLPARASVFGSLGYAQIGEEFLGRTCRLYVVESDRGWIAHPMLLRSLSDLPFAEEVCGRWDVSTPEYTGPFLIGSPDGLVEEYARLRQGLNLREGIIAEFAHLHPWSNCEVALDGPTVYDRDIVWVDTTLDPNRLWSEHVEHSCRKNISKAERAGISTREATSNEDIQAFLEIYLATMQRKQALQAYHFPYDYFCSFRERMPESSRFLLTVFDGKVIGALLVLHDDDNAYSYLGGTDAEYNHLRPSNFATWEVIKWAHRQGKKRVLLGGGYRRDDGIFRFKATFSQLRKPFHVYKRIHLADEYHQLERKSRSYHGITEPNVQYFPSYRYVGS